MQCQVTMLICNKPCNTCLELDCLWKGRTEDGEKAWVEYRAEERADEEERLGHYKEFKTMAELIKDLNDDSPGKS